MNVRHRTTGDANDRGAFLLATVGTTPGASARFLGEDRRERTARRASRAMRARRHVDHDETTTR